MVSGIAKFGILLENNQIGRSYFSYVKSDLELHKSRQTRDRQIDRETEIGAKTERQTQTDGKTQPRHRYR